MSRLDCLYESGGFSVTLIIPDRVSELGKFTGTTVCWV